MSPEISTELERVVQRWRLLPLDNAMSHAASVRALAQSLADGVARAGGTQTSVVPDCGLATLMDQLTVMVYDASAVAVRSGAALTATLAEDLVSLRRRLV